MPSKEAIMHRALIESGYLTDMLQDIADFHVKFDLPRPIKPTQLDIPDMAYRIQFLFEEMEELVTGFEKENMEEMFDALIDLVYVALGTAWLMGLPFADGWSRVHEANMKKVRAKDASESKRGNQLDVVKPEGWEPPILEDLLKEPSRIIK